MGPITVPGEVGVASGEVGVPGGESAAAESADRYGSAATGSAVTAAVPVGAEVD